MCGRYALALRPRFIRQRLHDYGMPSQDSVEDDDVRESYNFAPGYYGLVYREDVPDYGGGSRSTQEDTNDGEDTVPGDANDHDPPAERDEEQSPEPKYRLQAMKWGLIPFWTKQNPDYGSLMRTINCRDDSLAQKGGMWQTMKQRKRCIVIAQGFYEWLKKNNGKEKIPHYIKRKDDKLMCMAGLWDCVKYEDSPDKLYTYTIITTDSNKQLNFLHDRMPVILESGSKEMFAWLNSSKSEWTSELQTLLKPYKGELEIYPVTQEVGKVGNNSPNFIIPVNSTENKNNIANFFGNQKRKAEGQVVKTEIVEEQEKTVSPLVRESKPSASLEGIESSENNAPNPEMTRKHERDDPDEGHADDSTPRPTKSQKMKTDGAVPKTPVKAKRQPSATTTPKSSPEKVKASPGNSKITSFFNK